MAEFIIGNVLRRSARDHPRLRRVLWRLDYALVWSLVKLFSLLPAATASRLGNRIGRVLGILLKRKSAIFHENFSVAFPEKSVRELDELVLEAWGNGGRVLAEYPHLPTILAHADDGWLEVEILEPIASYTDSTRPAVIVGAHHCNWEIICSAMAYLGMPNASLYSPPTNPLLDKMLLESRSALLCELFPRDNSARPLMRAIRQGRTAGAVVDRRIDDGKPITFFGKEKPSTIMSAKLALKFNLELIPVRIQRTGDARFKATFYPPLRAADPEASETEQAINMTWQLHQLFEEWIRDNPGDWFCSKRMWPKQQKRNANRQAKKSGIDSYAA